MTSTTASRLKLIVSDYVMCNIGWLVFNILRYFSLPPGYDPRPLESWLFTDRYILLGQLLFPLMTVGLYAVAGVYNHPGVKSRIDQVVNTISVSFIAMLLIFFTVLINDNIPERLQNYELMLLLWMLLFVPTLIGRIIVGHSFMAARRRGIGVHNAIVVGPAEQAVRLERLLNRNPRGSDFVIVGNIEPDADAAHISQAIARHDARAIILGVDPRAISDNLSLMSNLFNSGLDVYAPLDIYQLIMSNPRITSVASEPLINLTTANIPDSTTNLKRLGDIVVSSLALIALAPVMAVIAVAIKHDSDGPVFYRQERVGYRSKTFNIIKFRSMRTDAEANGPALSSADDPRITNVGRTLRKYRLDELPQFWNVLVGQMSIVGPRPERRFFADQIAARAPHYNLIHQVRPGITSWGMVKYGYAGNVDQMIERLRYDILYLENVSLSVDLKILFYTINTVATGRGI